MKRIAASLALVFALLAGAAFAQEKGATQKKSHILVGKVEGVNPDSLTVNHEKVEGYMGAMTMGYKVDKPEVLKKVKVGDQIRATVYDDDYTLHDVQVVPPTDKNKK